VWCGPATTTLAGRGSTREILLALRVTPSATIVSPARVQE